MRNIISRVMANLLGMDLSKGIDMGNGYFDFGEMPTDYSAFSFPGEGTRPAVPNNGINGPLAGTPNTTTTNNYGFQGPDFGPFPPGYTNENPIGRGSTGTGITPTIPGIYTGTGIERGSGTGIPSTIPGLGQQAGYTNVPGGGNIVGRGSPAGGTQQKNYSMLQSQTPTLQNGLTTGQKGNNTFRGSFRRKQPGGYMGY